MPVNGRFVWLVAANMLLACVPVAYRFLPADIRFLPLMWALASISIGQWMLLGIWAALGSGRIRWRMAVVMMVAGLLGVLNSIISGNAAFAWWLAPGWVLASLLTPATVIASLLVVRAQGYRLVAKRRGR